MAAFGSGRCFTVGFDHILLFYESTVCRVFFWFTVWLFWGVRNRPVASELHEVANWQSLSQKACGPLCTCASHLVSGTPAALNRSRSQEVGRSEIDPNPAVPDNRRYHNFTARCRDAFIASHASTNHRALINFSAIARSPPTLSRRRLAPRALSAPTAVLKEHSRTNGLPYWWATKRPLCPPSRSLAVTFPPIYFFGNSAFCDAAGRHCQYGWRRYARR